VQDCFRESTDAGRLYRAIVDGIAAESKAEGAAFRILILPGRDDLLELGPDRRGYWTDWVERCRRDGLSVMDVSSACCDSGVAFDDLFAPLGHYKRDGHAYRRSGDRRSARSLNRSARYRLFRA
jgi:hypothetical protein